MRIALDAMGGDFAPGPVLQGAVQAVQKDSEMHVVLVGDAAQIEPLLGSVPDLRARLEVFHASQVITMDDPAAVVRTKPDNSISRCWQLSQVGPSAAPTIPRWPVAVIVFRRPPNVKSISLM